MNATADRMPGDREYAAAVAEMQHTYGHGYRPGQHVYGVTCGKTWHGVIVQVVGNRIDIEAAGAWLILRPQDIAGVVE